MVHAILIAMLGVVIAIGFASLLKIFRASGLGRDSLCRRILIFLAFTVIFFVLDAAADLFYIEGYIPQQLQASLDIYLMAVFMIVASVFLFMTVHSLEGLMRKRQG